MTLGDYIKEYRQAHKYSMDDFAKRSGLSKAYVSILERNYNPSTKKAAIPSLETVKRVAIATNIDFNDLIALLDQEISLDPGIIQIEPPTEKVPSISADDKELLRKFHCLDDRGKAAVLNVLNHEYESLPGEKPRTTPKEA